MFFVFPTQSSDNPIGSNAGGTNYKDNGVSVGCDPWFGDVHFSRRRRVNSEYFSPCQKKNVRDNFMFS